MVAGQQEASLLEASLLGACRQEPYQKAVGRLVEPLALQGGPLIA